MDEFLNDLLTQTGATQSADPETINQLKTDMTERVAALINRRLIDALPDDQVAELETLLDTQPENVEAFQQFITEHVPNKDQVVAATLLEFRALYLGAAA